MNILFAADVSAEKVIGGAERVLFEQAVRLSTRGHNIHILTRRIPSHKASGKSIHGVTEWRYAVRKENALTFLYSTVVNGKHLYERLQSEYCFDVINFMQPFSALPVLLSGSARYVWKLYTCLSLSFEEYMSRNVPKAGGIGFVSHFFQVKLRKLIEREVLKKSDRIVVLSDYTTKRLSRFHGINPGKVIVIPAGVDLERFRPAPKEKDLRRRLDIPEDRILLFTVRNLVPRMGLEALIDAMPTVVRHHPDSVLLIGGKGPLGENLTRRVAARNLDAHVRFCGFIPEERLPEYYRAADLFVLPTRELEGFGLVTLEAMASGLPVVGTPIGGTLEILTRFDPGFLFRDISDQAISEMIIEKLKIFRKDPKKWQRLKKECRQFAETYFDWERNIDEMEKVFCERKQTIAH